MHPYLLLRHSSQLCSMEAKRDVVENAFSKQDGLLTD